MDNILVLGGAGFIGERLTRALVSVGYGVRIFTRRGGSIENVSDLFDRVEIHRGDFQDSFAVKAALVGVDIVIHLVTTTYPNSHTGSSVYDIETNLVPTVRLLEECSQAGVKKVIYLSSGGTIYGEPKTVPIDENHPLEPLSIYGHSKKLVESYLDFYAANSDLLISTLRVSNPYGPGQNPYGVQGLIAIACAHLLEDREMRILGDGSSVRDYLYIDDLISAMLSTIKLEEPIKVNISSSKGHSIIEILAKLEEISNLKFRKRYSETPLGYVQNNILSNLLAQELLAWKPQFSIDHGLSETWRWILESRRER